MTEWFPGKSTDSLADDLADAPALRAAFGLAGTVVAPVPAGAGDQAALEAAIAAVPEGGKLVLQSSPLGVPYQLTAPLTVTKSMTIEGDALQVKVPDALAYNPSTSTLRGAVLQMTTAGQDCLRIVGTALDVSLRRFGVLFSSGLATTGHGIVTESTTHAIKQGTWADLAVMHHDGNHYAYYLRNTILITTSMLRSFGGGGMMNYCDSTQGNLGNAVHTHFQAYVNKGGSAHGIAHYSSSAGTPGRLNLMTYIRPQVNVASAVTAASGATNHTWHDSLGSADPTNVVAINPDFEYGSGAVNLIAQGEFTEFIGGVLTNGVGTLNTTYGYRSLRRSHGGGSNVAFGQEVLPAVTTGSGNVGVGYSSSSAITTGSRNVGVGLDSNNAVIIGSDNVAVGHQAHKAGTGSSNTAVGSKAMLAGTGNNNVVAGFEADATGSNATVVGYQASAVGNNAVALGRGTVATGVGSVAIGRDSGGASAAAAANDDFALGTANHKVKILGRLTVAQRTPSSSADSQGAVGDITADDNYVYAKTSTGWKRAALTAW